MISRATVFQLLALALLAATRSAAAFSVDRQTRTFQPSLEHGADRIGKFVAAVPVAIAASPLVALAEEVDDYEYGAVNAPIGIAWAAGVLAILTALLPLALQGGEEAFEEMKERDAGKWGTGQTDALNRKKK